MMMISALLPIILLITTIHAQELELCSVDGIIRLAGAGVGNNPNPTEGRIEVCFNGTWGTVCDDGWNFPDAAVVCKQLGIPGASEAKTFSHFGSGTGPIHIESVDCKGTEESLFDCSYLTDHDCFHYEDAGVTCGLDVECQGNEIRLVGGENEMEGRVELCTFGLWGKVCDDLWDVPDARVLCKELGFPYLGAVPYGSAHFGLNPTFFAMDNVECTGNESSIRDCQHSQIHNCFSFEDAGVVCMEPECNDWDLRLVNGFTEYEGRLEVCRHNFWGTVCYSSEPSFARVVCKQLNLPYEEAIAIGNAYFGRGTGISHLSSIFCTGNETNISSCSYYEWNYCSHRNDVSVICVDTVGNCSEGEVRLVGGENRTSGRVEVCLGGEWGTVCDDFWDVNDAKVVCRHLGYSTQGVQAHRSSSHGQGVGSIHLDDVHCNGNESDLLACTYTSDHNCGHFEDAAVSCRGPGDECVHGEIKLVDGGDDYNQTAGRVEICYEGYWGTVCRDDWTYEDARVVCKQLNLPFEGAKAIRDTRFGLGSGDIPISEVQCTGDEDSLINCTYTIAHSCSHYSDSGVVCAEAVCEPMELRLVDGDNVTEGRVEACVNGQWHTICDDFWGFQEARVLCRELGQPWEGAIALGQAHHGTGDGEIAFSGFTCTGDEDSLFDCSYGNEYLVYCSRFEDAGVRCLPNPMECNDTNDIRLVGGSTETEGRLELCDGGSWGTVCDDYWEYEDSVVACRHLGYPTEAIQYFKLAAFGEGSGNVYYANFECNGTENSLDDCARTTEHYCTHREDVSVSCGMKECEEGDLRLVNGRTPNEGRVEICYRGLWGTVCDDFWDYRDALVVCNSLDLPTGRVLATTFAEYGMGMGPINLDDVLCTGYETSLLDCPFTPNHNCHHAEDAGVICAARECQEGSIRLVNGANEYEGRVEVCLRGGWGTVCDDFWDNLDATVVCRQLGYSEENATSFSLAYFGEGEGIINLDNVQCTGDERTIFNCSYYDTHNCDHYEDAGVRCLPSPLPTVTTTRSIYETSIRSVSQPSSSIGTSRASPSQPVLRPGRPSGLQSGALAGIIAAIMIVLIVIVASLVVLAVILGRRVYRSKFQIRYETHSDALDIKENGNSADTNGTSSPSNIYVTTPEDMHDILSETELGSDDTTKLQ